MKKNMRCNVCGRKRKPSHEERAETTDNKYNPGCKNYQSTKK